MSAKNETDEAKLFENLFTMSAKNETDEANDLNEVARYVFIVIGAGEVMSGVIGNLILLATLLNRRSLHLRNVHNLLLANLALADLVAMGYWFPFLVLDLILGKNFLSENHCRINAFVITTCVLVAVMSLVGISFNRYLRLCRPHLFAKIVTLSRTIICNILCWAICSVLALTPFFGLGEYGYIPDLHVCSFKRKYKYDPNDHMAFYLTILTCIFLTIPMCFVGYWNFTIFRHWKSRHITSASRYPFIKVSSNGERDPGMTRTNCLTNEHTMNRGQRGDESQEVTSANCLTISMEELLEDNGPNASHGLLPVGSFVRAVVNENPIELTLSEGSELAIHRAPIHRKGTQPEMHETAERPLVQQEGNSQQSVVTTDLTPFSKTPLARRTPLSSLSDGLEVEVSHHVQQLKRKAQEMRNREKAFVRSLFVVFMLMFVSFLPFIAVIIAQSQVNVQAEVTIFSDLLLFFSSAVNWIVYGAMNRSFRLECARILDSLCGRCAGKRDHRKMEKTGESVNSTNMLSLHRLNTFKLHKELRSTLMKRERRLLEARGPQCSEDRV